MRLAVRPDGEILMIVQPFESSNFLNDNYLAPDNG